MHRNRTAASSVKASPTTRCQKCLKLGHYSFQCKASAQERPYISRPSRTQQLLNPQLQPKLVEATPPDQPSLTNKKGTADAILKQKEEERALEGRGRKRRRDSDTSAAPARSRSSSVSSYSSYSSVSSGRSPTPPGYSENRAASYSSARSARSPRRHRRRSRSSTHSPDHERTVRRKYRDSPSPRRRGRQLSPTDLPRRTRSRSPKRPLRRSVTPQYVPPRWASPRRRSPPRRDHGDSPLDSGRKPEPSRRPEPPRRPSPPKERSPSPFTKRRLMTEAMRRGA